MNTTSKKSIPLTLCATLVAGLLGLSGGVHALCLNPDGSVDDPSMSTDSIDVALLPACESINKPIPVTPGTGKPQAQIEPAVPVLEKPLKKKRSEPNASLDGDCRTGGGESQVGSLGAVEMLPVCGV